MADNYQKLPVYRSINNAAQNRAGDAAQELGKSLPCTVKQVISSGIVTVTFQVKDAYTFPDVTIPVAWPEYTRYPIQAGCKGFAISADARLGGVSGQGGGVASLTTVGNLGALAFQPLGNTNWMHVGDGNTMVVYGEPNVLLMDKTGASMVSITPTNIIMSSGGHTVTINSSGISFDGILFATHTHSGVESGSSDTGPVAT